MKFLFTPRLAILRSPLHKLGALPHELPKQPFHESSYDPRDLERCFCPSKFLTSFCSHCTPCIHFLLTVPSNKECLFTIWLANLRLFYSACTCDLSLPSSNNYEGLSLLSFYSLDSFRDLSRSPLVLNLQQFSKCVSCPDSVHSLPE